MIKLLFWGIIFFVGYLYLKPRLDAGNPREDVLDDDDEYITIKVPKNKKKSNNEDLTNYEEVE